MTAKKRPVSSVDVSGVSAVEATQYRRRAIRHLAGACDGARSKDSKGFSKADRALGKELDETRVWSYEQECQADRLVLKYWGQVLRAMGFDPTELPQPKSPAIARVGGTCLSCGMRFAPGTEIFFVEKNRIHATCPPAPQNQATLASVDATVTQSPVTEPEALPVMEPDGTWTSRSVLGPGGIISQKLPGYEARAPQLAMAELIEQCMANHENAVVEAGTGTGKSLAYLVPAIRSATANRQTWLISTADKALQGQIVGKDIPFLKSVMPVSFKAVLLKGRRNYVCLRNADALRNGKVAYEWEGQEEYQRFGEFLTWLDAEQEGDIESYPIELGRLKDELTVGSNGCTGKSCNRYAECFVEKKKKDARNAHIVVVNHALLMRDLMLRGKSDGFFSVLPNADGIVLDEAHHLEDIATDAFGIEVTTGQLDYTFKRISRYTVDHDYMRTAEEQSEARLSAEKIADLAYSLTLSARMAFDVIKERLGKDPVRKLGLEGDTFKAVFALGDELYTEMTQAMPIWLATEETDIWQKLAERVNSWVNEVHNVAEPINENYVRYAEATEKSVRLCAKPIDVSGELRDYLWNATLKRRKRSAGEDEVEETDTQAPPVMVMSCSATIATSNGFTYWRERVGMDRGKELLVASPFDYERSALLYLPYDGRAFDPQSSRQDETMAYYDRLAAEYESLMLASKGRAFCLFTSFRALNEVYDRLAPRLRLQHLVLRQGEMPRPELTKRFREDGNAVLFGVKSFWEGVDVQGEALSIVIIDKLPFNPPTDPVWEARCQAVNKATGDQWAWFNKLAIPVAVIALKQGFGRLIRTGSDRGVVALLDGRLTTKNYGGRIVKALPPATQTRSLDAVRAWFGN